jgi:hypothetical protein
MGRENHCGETPAAGALGEARLNRFLAGSLIAPITWHRRARARGAVERMEARRNACLMFSHRPTSLLMR